MIPKIIHYCWFGRGSMTPLMKKCLRSWKKFCPDYEIIEWNEDNFDKRVKRHQKKWYKKWEKIRIFPQNTLRAIVGDEMVDEIKNRFSKR